MAASWALRTSWILALAVATPAWAQETGELAEALIRLRGEVEQLNSELELLRQEQRTTLGGLAAQRADLQAQLERQQRSTRELAQRRDAAMEAAQAAGVAGQLLAPVLRTALDGLDAGIAAGLPFKRDERLGVVAELRAQLDSGALPPERAVNRLWALYEDELRLTRDNSLHSQPIPLDGERVLADVAKLGMVALYFRTSDGRLGHAQRSAQGWTFQRVEDPADIAAVAAVFDALGKQIRQGYFVLPGTVAGAAP